MAFYEIGIKQYGLEEDGMLFGMSTFDPITFITIVLALGTNRAGSELASRAPRRFSRTRGRDTRRVTGHPSRTRSGNQLAVFGNERPDVLTWAYGDPDNTAAIR